MLASIIRTVVPVIVGVLLGWAAKVGLDLPEGPVTQLVTIVITGAYYALARWVESWWPAAGRILLAAGLTKKQPSYDVAA
ncbi:hypothetical protein [Thermoactinospora rubra]|uniref:hypothetical protein n=1 Tax=Thermoactinospora rubra TaxID=1088767 RepID=UPI000A0F9BC9|nr:hypothetical protein [Thermoactinospora rubra]